MPHRSASDLRRKFTSEHCIKPGDVVVLRVSATTAQNAIVTEHKGELYAIRLTNGPGKSLNISWSGTASFRRSNFRRD